MPRHMPVNARVGRKAVRATPDKGGRSRTLREGAAGGKSAASHELSAADAAFLYLERKEMPLAIACLTLFDGPIPYQDFVASVASKLHLVPRYQQRVVMPPLNIGMPTWQDDPIFDIRRHVLRVTVPAPGGEAELEALVGKIFSRVLDRSKPLWEIYVVDGLKGGRGALIWRLHHALADGISGTRLLEVFLDAQPQDSSILRPPSPTPPSSNGASPGGIAGVVQTTLGGLIAKERELLGLAQTIFGAPRQDGSKGLVDFLPELLVSVERLPFNKPCREGRKFCWADFDMAEVQAIRDAVGGRVNDVILSVLTRALARYVKLHGQSVMKRYVRIIVPVSLRKAGQEGKLGNQITFIPVALPLDVQDPAEMLRAVAARTEVMKHSGAAAVLGIAAACIAKAPPPLQALFWWGLPELILPVPLFNMICTNVPGPPNPLYALGRRMIAAYPQVPTGYDLGINCAVESYDGKLFFGLVADAHAAPDVTRLRDFLYVAFRELSQAARKTARPRAKQARQRRARVAPRRRPVRKQVPPSIETASQVIAEPAMASPAMTDAAPADDAKIAA